MKNTNPLQAETYYHIYNRGINGEDLFKVDANYSFFLKKYAQYISGIACTYAYCLLKNHFHLLLRTKSEREIMDFHRSRNPVRVLNPNRVKEKTASQIISLQFSHLFNGYTQAINKQQGRTGKLFELPFRRIEVNHEAYFSQLVYYIHANPQRHGFLDDFREYPYSSYHSHISDKKTQLERQKVLKWYGSPSHYRQYHDSFQDLSAINPLVFDD